VITSDGMAHLVALPNLASLGADGKLSDDIAMGHFAARPRLRRLRIQESAATEAGFEALAQSRSLSHIWGRESRNFASRSFVAFSKMPALRTLGINCSKVDDAALATLPDFPALRELTPIGFQDGGFAHVGKCTRLQRLTCMYCRDTTDAVLTGFWIWDSVSPKLGFGKSPAPIIKHHAYGTLAAAIILTSAGFVLGIGISS